MDNEYWLKQNPDKPLFEDLLWSRPENKTHAGKLLIIGGNLHFFAAPAQAYNEALKAGVGVAKVLLPDKLQKTIGSVLENGEFAPSNKSGSFARNALAEWLDFAGWADGVLLAGDLGRNSETTIVTEEFLQKYSGQVTIAKDAVDSISASIQHTLERPNTTLVISIAQLQKICKDTACAHPVQFDMGNIALVEHLHDFTLKYNTNIIVLHNELLYVAVKGEVSTTKVSVGESWRVKTAAYAATWWLQNPHKTFEALTTSIAS